MSLHAGTEYGTVYLFKDFKDNLYVTVSARAQAAGQVLFSLPNEVTGQTGTGSVLLASYAAVELGSPDTKPNYVDQV